MFLAYSDMNAGGQWWTRSWLWSLTPENGGAPEVPILYTKGLSRDFFRLGPIYINNKFKLKLKTYSFVLTEPESAHKWKMKIKPQVKVGIKDLIRRARLAIRWTYSYKHRRMLYVQIHVGYRVGLNFAAGIQISFLNW
jgi:hypothetical protein